MKEMKFKAWDKINKRMISHEEIEANEDLSMILSWHNIGEKYELFMAQ